MKTVIITVDLEDWFQVENLRPFFPHEVWDSSEYRVEKGTLALLDLFDRYNVKATFFALGWIAKKSPSLIKKINDAGHEVASHGNEHRLLTEMPPAAIRDDILASKMLIEDLTGKPVAGYRAPSFTISLGLLKTLKELGFFYDSSLNTFSLHGRYGNLDLNEVGALSLSNKLYSIDGLFEIPVSNMVFGTGMVLPWAGGGYFRLIPYTLFSIGVRKILKDRGFYCFYCHPWEFDPGQPRVREVPWDKRFRHYVGLTRSLNKLGRLLRDLKALGCAFSTCGDYCS